MRTINNIIQSILLWITGVKIITLIRTWGRMKVRNKYTRNPLLRVSRNTLCICGSGDKVKRCCGQQKWVERKWANDVQEVLDSLDKKQKFAVGYRR